MDYENPRTNQEKKSEPHPDCRKNVEQFERMIARTYWIPEYVYEISTPEGKKFINYTISDSRSETIFDPTIQKHVTVDQIVSYKFATFIWGTRGKEKKTTILSFHQTHKDYERKQGFSFEISYLLNLLGSEGFIQHRERENDGKPRSVNLHKRVKAFREPRPELGEIAVKDKEGRICPIDVWIDIPERSSVQRKPNDWEKMFGQ